MTTIKKLNNYTKKALNEDDLKSISGGVLPAAVLVGGVLVYLSKQAFEHSDQISKGFKKGYK